MLKMISTFPILLILNFMSFVFASNCMRSNNPKFQQFKNISQYCSYNFTIDRNTTFYGYTVLFQTADMGSLTKGIFNASGSNLISNLILEHAGVKDVQDGAFLSLDCLVSLDLKGNKIKDLSRGSLKGPIGLVNLDLSGNLLGEVAPYVFDLGNSLMSLNLSYNTIKTLHPHSFNLTHLQELDLSHNALSTIPNEAFQYFRSLDVLRLGSNKIEEISLEKWTNLTSLSTLDLSNNLLKSFDTGYAFPFKSLTALYVNHNHLSKFNISALRKSLPNVVHIRLDGNRFPCSELVAMQEATANFKISNESKTGQVTIDLPMGCKKAIPSSATSTAKPSAPTTQTNRTYSLDVEMLDAIKELRRTTVWVIILILLFGVFGVVLSSGVLRTACNGKRLRLRGSSAENITLL